MNVFKDKVIKLLDEKANPYLMERVRMSATMI